MKNFDKVGGRRPVDDEIPKPPSPPVKEPEPDIPEPNGPNGDDLGELVNPVIT